MGFKQKLVVAFSEKGKRKNNEDYISPSIIDEQSNVYVLCDGVGGSHYGEVASEIVSKSIAFYLKKKEPFFYQKKSYLNKSLKFAEERLSEYIERNPESKNMATTAVCLEFSNNNALGYWVGDSRIYQVRGNEILFKSKDHSLLQELMEKPNVDLKDVQDSPIKNFILKAVKGNHHPVKASAFSISDIQENDYFVLLSDGVLESFSDEELIKVLVKHNRDMDSLEKEIREKCELNSADNYSIQIIKITN